MKRKWQRACGTTNHSSPPSSLSQPPLLPFQRSLPPVYHSSTAGAMSTTQTFLSPTRHGSRIGIASSGSPPVRDRVVSGGTNGLVNGAVGYTSPHASYRLACIKHLFCYFYKQATSCDEYTRHETSHQLCMTSVLVV